MGDWNCCFLLCISFRSDCQVVCMLDENACFVQQVQCLDPEGYWVKRTVFLNMDKTFKYGLMKVLNDKTIVNSYSTNRKILYV